YCRRFYSELEPLLQRYQGRIHFVFRNFPLDNSCNPKIPEEMHLYACHAAAFARCAGEQGKFWQATSYLFTLPEVDEEGKTGVNEAIDRGAEKLSLDASAIQECIKSDRPRKKFYADIDAAMALHIEGTPFVFINGKEVKLPSFEALQRIFDSILK